MQRKQAIALERIEREEKRQAAIVERRTQRMQALRVDTEIEPDGLQPESLESVADSVIDSDIGVPEYEPVVLSAPQGPQVLPRQKSGAVAIMAAAVILAGLSMVSASMFTLSDYKPDPNAYAKVIYAPRAAGGNVLVEKGFTVLPEVAVPLITETPRRVVRPRTRPKPATSAAQVRASRLQKILESSSDPFDPELK